jgi:phosphonate transport system substrate-binding protein
MSAAEVIVGAVAYHPRVVTVWERFREYFVDAELALDYVLFSNYERQVEAVLERVIDIGWNTNTAYVSLNERSGGQSRILGMRDIDVDYASVLVVRKGDSVPELRSLAGHALALGSRDSGHAAILPLYYLAQEGLNGEDACELVRFDTHLGKHGDTGDSELRVVRAVAAGEARAGALSAAYFSALRMQGVSEVADLEILWRSPTYHHCNFTTLLSFDERLAQRFSDALLAMDFADPTLRPAMELENVRRWVPGGREGYESLECAMRAQGYLT